MRYDITVVTPVYNGSDFLTECIESVRNEIGIDIEHIIIDDGSTDSSFDIANNYPGIVVFKQKNSGAPSARNLGLQHAKGKYIKFLDADDVLKKGSLKKQFFQIEKNRENSQIIPYGYRDIIWERRRIMNRKILRGTLDNESKNQCTSQYIACRITRNIMTSLPLYPTSALKKVGGFDLRLSSSQEWNLNIRLAAEGFIFQYDDVHCYTQRIHNSTTRISNRKLIPQKEIDNDLVTYEFVKKYISDEYVRNAWALRLWNKADSLAALGYKSHAEYLYSEAVKLNKKSELLNNFGLSYRLLVNVFGETNVSLLRSKVRKIIKSCITHTI